MNVQDCRAYAGQLSAILNLQTPPLAISFTAQPGAAPLQGAMPAPTADGRTGKVPAGCVFWIKAQDRTFSTTAEDHANCSVGSVTHGFKKLDEVGDRNDVAALVEAGWVSPDMFPQIPVVQERPESITYGPLEQTAAVPDVVLLRVNAKQAMMLSDAIPDVNFQGKPQCHIIPMAKEQEQVAISVGCMLSRVRTGMANTEMTCAIPSARLPGVIEALHVAAQADKTVAAYAADDSKRFGDYLTR